MQIRCDAQRILHAWPALQVGDDLILLPNPYPVDREIAVVVQSGQLVDASHAPVPLSEVGHCLRSAESRQLSKHYTSRLIRTVLVVHDISSVAAPCMKLFALGLLPKCNASSNLSGAAYNGRQPLPAPGPYTHYAGG